MASCTAAVIKMMSTVLIPKETTMPNLRPTLSTTGPIQIDAIPQPTRVYPKLKEIVAVTASRSCVYRDMMFRPVMGLES
jgi:hypothetical protein